MIKINKNSLVNTCIACPSQWEGTLADGRMYYIRYRWGHLSIRVSAEPTTNINDAVCGESVYEDDYGEGMDGMMGERQLLEVLKYEEMLEE